MHTINTNIDATKRIFGCVSDYTIYMINFCLHVALVTKFVGPMSLRLRSSNKQIDVLKC